MDFAELLESLNKALAELPRGDDARLDHLRRRTEMMIRKVFGEKSKYLKDLEDITFYPMVGPADDEDDKYVISAWTSGAHQLKNLLDTMAEELTLAGPRVPGAAPVLAPTGAPQRVFVVHGRDEEMKQSVSRTLEKLGLGAVILHEQPNQGRTIIEKFTEYASAPFAVILLSGDDLAHARGESADKARPRARQNVILELGYFLGKLGRDRVLVVYRGGADFEMPSDYSGVLFTAFDTAGRWQLDLVRELKAAGYAVDANKIL